MTEVLGPFSPIGPPASCSGGCGKATANPELASWDYLPISQRWRCWDCTRALQSVGRTKEHSAPDMTEPTGESP
jgi:hypothetical protein